MTTISLRRLNSDALVLIYVLLVFSLITLAIWVRGFQRIHDNMMTVIDTMNDILVHFGVSLFELQMKVRYVVELAFSNNVTTTKCLQADISVVVFMYLLISLGVYLMYNLALGGTLMISLFPITCCIDYTALLAYQHEWNLTLCTGHLITRFITSSLHVILSEYAVPCYFNYTNITLTLT